MPFTYYEMYKNGKVSILYRRSTYSKEIITKNFTSP